MRRLGLNSIIGLAILLGLITHVPMALAQASKSGKDSQSPSSKPKGKPRTEVAVFGGGCFWSIEAIFEHVRGVKSVVSGFSGGTVRNPSYDQVCTGMTGHAEVVRIEYDPSVISFDKLLTVFWMSHDPTTWNRQGDDFGPQYRSTILYLDEEQKQAALKSYRELTDRRVFGDPIVTELIPFRAFYPAEYYHQNYYRNQKYSDYSLIYILPKLKKLKLVK
jgi:peptide-methionine (S)-S-oxide reductase